MKLPLYQIDAFAGDVFRGNPAAIVPLDKWLPTPLMQQISAENNLSETAFFVLSDDHAEQDPIELRWFTPKAEVDLCGHATLASGHILFTTLRPAWRHVSFSTRSGILGVDRLDDGRLAMDFPALTSKPFESPADLISGLAQVLGPLPVELRSGTYLIAVYESADHIDSLRYNADLEDLIARAGAWGLCATAPGANDTRFDFVSRFFAPAKGVPEDPVTGSAHCLLAPYWAERLGKNQLTAYQASQRGGIVGCTVKRDRVTLEGACTLYMAGTIMVAD